MWAFVGTFLLIAFCLVCVSIGLVSLFLLLLGLISAFWPDHEEKHN